MLFRHAPHLDLSTEDGEKEKKEKKEKKKDKDLETQKASARCQ